MKEVGIDISHHKSKKINNNEIEQFDLVITLCGDAKDKCPAIPPNSKHLHWDIEDPAIFKGTTKEIIEKFSEVRDNILYKIKLLKTEIKKDLICI